VRGGQHPDAARDVHVPQAHGVCPLRDELALRHADRGARHEVNASTHTRTPPGFTPPLQVHGLADRAMHLYMAQAEDPLRIVRGGIFGGTLPYIECALKAYVIALHQTLTDGYVGTEECIWAIIVKRFPHLFVPF